MTVPTLASDAASRTKFASSFMPQMVAAEYKQGAWGEVTIVDYAPLTLDPATACLHYGQTIFEGLKCHRQGDDQVAIFRLQDHLERMNASAARMSMPAIAPEQVAPQLVELIARHADTVPAFPGSLYIRPMMVATTIGMGVSPSASYLFLIIAGPVGSYFSGDAIRMRTETHYVRAAHGGTGGAKCGGNYGAAMIAQQAAVRDGFDQVLWLDAGTRGTIEELSAMNFMMVEDGQLVSPPISDTVLRGITSLSIFDLAEDLGIPAIRREVTLAELAAPKVSEVFCCGTAAVITPVREVVHEGRTLFDCEGAGPVGTQLRQALTEIHQGQRQDTHGWLTHIPAPAAAS